MTLFHMYIIKLDMLVIMSYFQVAGICTSVASLGIIVYYFIAVAVYDHIYISDNLDKDT